MIFAIALIFLASVVTFPLVKAFNNKALLPGVLLLLATAAWLLSELLQLINGGAVKVESLQWVPALGLNLTFRLTVLTTSFALLVVLAGALVMTYSISYFKSNDAGLPRFSSLMFAFAASMLGLVLADNFYIMFVFWELTTVLSFLLIGHQYKMRAARSAALQALVITAMGGLAMLVGIVMLTSYFGTASITQIFAAPLPDNTTVAVAVILLLMGAITKSAIFPFHFWLPGAMAAPTPVSAYLHAAAMVKAGIFLVALIMPAAVALPAVRETLVVFGAITMILGGLRALKQNDLKLLIAHSTVSQLGMLMILFGVGTKESYAAALLLVFAHAVAKAPLFLVVGVIDKRFKTRDIRELCGVGKAQPALATVAALASLSLAGAPVLLGFVAKENALGALYGALNPASLYATPLNDTTTAQVGDFIAIIAFVAFIVGSALTVAYLVRYWFGAFSIKKRTPKSADTPVSNTILLAPIIFVVLALTGGIFSKQLTNWLQQLAGVGAEYFELGLWHGFTPELLTTIAVFLVGILVGLMTLKMNAKLPASAEKFNASHIYWRALHAFEVFAVRVTMLVQRGSLPWYLGVVMLTLAVVVASTFRAFSSDGLVLWQHWAEVPIALVMIMAVARVVTSKTRFKSVILVGATGYAMVALFAFYGAPDLAITQALVETVTLITFILVIRKLPRKIVSGQTRIKTSAKAVVSVAAALSLGIVAAVALALRQEPTISEAFAQLAVEGGHGLNIVNVTLVDIRGWDTMGELSVVIAAATGVASLIFLSSRGDSLPKMSRKTAKYRARSHLLKVVDPLDDTNNTEWIMAGARLAPQNRSIILEVVVRLVFHALMLFSLYLLLAGHNAPGGGFAGGLVAGIALAARYLAGGRHELGATVHIDAGKLLGTGLALATLTALVPLFFGSAALSSSWFDISLGPLSEISFVTSTVFDIGVYLVVLGLMLDVLRSLGAEIDRKDEEAQQQEEVLAK